MDLQIYPPCRAAASAAQCILGRILCGPIDLPPVMSCCCCRLLHQEQAALLHLAHAVCHMPRSGSRSTSPSAVQSCKDGLIGGRADVTALQQGEGLGR